MERGVNYLSAYMSPLGEITLASDGEALTGLWFVGQKYYASALTGENERRELPVFSETRRWLDMYFAGDKPDFTPKLDPKGSEFRRKVWDALLEIPYGETVTYGKLAKKLGCRSARAVGGAVGHNPISVIIPCHRVLGSDGSLTGYAGGTDRKRGLLSIEKINTIF